MKDREKMKKSLRNFLINEDGAVTNTVGSGAIAGVGVAPADPNQAKADPTFANPPGLLGVLNRIYRRKRINTLVKNK